MNAAKPKVTNIIHHNGQTYTRTGRRYSHAVITVTAATEQHTGNSYPVHVEWASTLELAQRGATEGQPVGRETGQTAEEH